MNVGPTVPGGSSSRPGELSAQPAGTSSGSHGAEVSRFVVIGAGLAGASAAWRLAQRGHEVTVLERHVPATPQGSSHGSARIFRYAYGDPVYVRLVARAAAGWAELEALHGAPLRAPTGAVDFGHDRDVPALAGILEAEGIAHEVLSPDAAGERWPQIGFDSPVLHHPDGSVLDALGTVHAMLAAARSLGAQVRTGWPVTRVERTGAGFTVHADDGRTVQAERLVVAAGGWLPYLLDDLALPSAFLGVFPRLVVREENAFHFPYREEIAPAQAWPTIVYKGRDAGGAPMNTYALPGGRDASYLGQKVAEFNGGRIISSAAERTGLIDPGNRMRVQAFTERMLPGLEPEPYAEAACLFTTAPGEHFVIDGAEGVTVLSPCSGHGAKFAPLLGELAADVAAGEGPGSGGVPEEFRVLARSVSG